MIGLVKTKDESGLSFNASQVNQIISGIESNAFFSKDAIEQQLQDLAKTASLSVYLYPYQAIFEGFGLRQ